MLVTDGSSERIPYPGTHGVQQKQKKQDAVTNHGKERGPGSSFDAQCALDAPTASKLVRRNGRDSYCEAFGERDGIGRCLAFGKSKKSP